MEAPEDVSSGSTSGGDRSPNVPMAILMKKRKRTKRLRTSCSLPNIPPSSFTSSLDFSSPTKEEEDMARCLILLAQGRSGGGDGGGGSNTERIFMSRKFTETATTAGGKAGFYIYECKTCNKCFPSFQALGGHRASHKKPKLSTQSFLMGDPKQIAHVNGITYGIALNDSSPSGTTNYKFRVHECSICGSEFSSGQALGGHMRRHRSPPELQGAIKKDRSSNLLSLDLNLPAPTDQPTVAFLPTIVFSATSALVDCHY